MKHSSTEATTMQFAQRAQHILEGAQAAQDTGGTKADLMEATQEAIKTARQQKVRAA